MQFVNISKRQINISFSEPKTGEEILKDMVEAQKQFKRKDEYSITDNPIENDLIKSNNEKRQNNTIQEVKEVAKAKDFKEAKVEKDFASDVDKVLETFMIKKNGVWNVTSKIPNKILIKNLLPLTDDLKEKKQLVSEKNNLAIDECKKNKSFLELKLNNQVYKIKFLGE